MLMAFKQDHAQLLFELFYGHAQGRLAHEAAAGGAAKVQLRGHGHDITKFGQGHSIHLGQRAVLATSQPEAMSGS